MIDINLASLEPEEKIKALKEILKNTSDDELRKRILKEIEDAQLEVELEGWKRQSKKDTLKDLLHHEEEESLEKSVEQEQREQEERYKKKDEELGKDLYNVGSNDKEESLYITKDNKDSGYQQSKLEFKEDEEKKKRRW